MDMLSAGPTAPSCSPVCKPPVLARPLHSHGLPSILLPPKPWRNLLPSLCCSCAPLSSDSPPVADPPPVTRPKRIRRPWPYNRYPGDDKGIAEEMRFVAMKLRDEKSGSSECKGDDGEETWQPTMEGYLKYLVDSRLVFDTIETIVDRSDDVAYTYFRKTGLERVEALSKDIEHFSELGLVIPGPNSPGTTYAAYLKKIAGSSVPSFLTHFYNIYFAHISGGQVIGKQVSEKILKGRELEFYRWPDDPYALLKNVREALNKLAEPWPREQRRQCLRETAKCFRMSGQIIRLIILPLHKGTNAWDETKRKPVAEMSPLPSQNS